MQRIEQGWLTKSLVSGLIGLVMSSCIGAGGSTLPRHFEVLQAEKLPPGTQQSTSAELLYYASCDTTYLYLEQDGGQNLVVVDVTDPGRVRSGPK